MAYFRGESAFVEINGREKEILDRSRNQAKEFVRALLTEAGVDNVEAYLARLDGYKFLTSSLTREFSNNGVDTIHIPAGYLGEGTQKELSQKLAHEMVATLSSLKDGQINEAEKLMGDDTWQKTKKVTLDARQAKAIKDSSVKKVSTGTPRVCFYYSGAYGSV